jgi:hypothetical protein
MLAAIDDSELATRRDLREMELHLDTRFESIKGDMYKKPNLIFSTCAVTRTCAGSTVKDHATIVATRPATTAIAGAANIVREQAAGAVGSRNTTSDVLMGGWTK